MRLSHHTEQRMAFAFRRAEERTTVIEVIRKWGQAQTCRFMNLQLVCKWGQAQDVS